MRFFVNPAMRRVRTLDEGEPVKFQLQDEGVGDWREVSSKEYDEFRAQTRRCFTNKQLSRINCQGQKFVWLEPDVYEDDKGPFPCWLLGAASGIGYVGPISRSKYAAKKWAKEHNYICIEEKPDGV